MTSWRQRAGQPFVTGFARGELFYNRYARQRFTGLSEGPAREKRYTTPIGFLRPNVIISVVCAAGAGFRLAECVMRLAHRFNQGEALSDRVKPEAVKLKNVIRQSDERHDEMAGVQ